MSLYAVPSTKINEAAPVEPTQDTDDPDIQLQAYDALLPSFQSMAPLVLYFIHEVELISEAEYQEIQVPERHDNHFLEVLFPQ